MTQITYTQQILIGVVMSKFDTRDMLQEQPNHIATVLYLNNLITAAATERFFSRQSRYLERPV